VKTPEILYGASRQDRHNWEDGLVYGFDENETIKVVNDQQYRRQRDRELFDEINRLKAEIARKDAALKLIAMRIRNTSTWTGQDYEQLPLHAGAATRIVQIAEEALTKTEEAE